MSYNSKLCHFDLNKCLVFIYLQLCIIVFCYDRSHCQTWSLPETRVEWRCTTRLWNSLTQFIHFRWRPGLLSSRWIRIAMRGVFTSSNTIWREAGRRAYFYGMAIMEWVHVAWSGCIMWNPSEAWWHNCERFGAVKESWWFGAVKKSFGLTLSW